MDIGEVAFSLLIGATVLGSLFLWFIGSVWVLYALFKPRKVAADKRGKRIIFAYFVNALLCGLTFAFPDAEATVFNTIHSAFVSSTPYAEGGLALAFLAFVWLSPVVVVGFLIWLVIDVFSGATAAKVERRLKNRV